jgi:endo-1,4-beta-xylanase
VKNKLSRRDFLKLAGLTSAGMVLSACGMQATELTIPTSTSTAIAFTATPLPAITQTPRPTLTYTPSPPETIRDFADILGIKMAVMINTNKLGIPKYVESAVNIGNQIMLTDDLFFRYIFSQFDFHRVLDNWSDVQNQLENGKIPFENEILWNPWGRGEAGGLFEIASQHKMEVVIDNLLWSSDVPDSLLSANFTKDELAKIAEYMLKSKMLRYKGKVSEWSVIAESVSRNLWGDSKSAFWEKRIGYPDIVYLAFKWAEEIDPDSRLNLIEDNILDADTETSRQQAYTAFFRLLDNLKQNQVPIDGVSFENNFWVFAPPNPEKMLNTIKKVQSMDYKVGHAQTTVVLSDKFPIEPDRPRTVNAIDNKLLAQAKVYKDTFDVYTQTGSGFGYYGVFDGDSWYKALGVDDNDAAPLILDENFEPKPAYYAILDVLKELYSKKT